MSVILDRLTRVRQSKPGSWMAACPCCESRKGRPLAVTETSDGRTLIHAFCGCSTEDVLGRLGLTINDLFAAPLATRLSLAVPSVPAWAVVEALDHEVQVLGVIVSDFLETKKVSESDFARLAVAARRIGTARDYIKARSK